MDGTSGDPKSSRRAAAGAVVFPSAIFFLSKPDPRVRQVIIGARLQP
jgi:hypothetical protein